jgi:hypothetical protein
MFANTLRLAGLGACQKEGLMYHVTWVRILGLIGGLGDRLYLFDPVSKPHGNWPRRHGRSAGLGVTANRTRSGLVSLFFGGTILLSISLSGCSSEHTVPPPTPPRASGGLPSPQGDTAKSMPASVFGHAEPVSAAEWWKKYPNDAPAPVGEYTLLLNERGQGPRSFTLASVAQYGSLMMAITCVHKDKYRLEVATAKNPT